MDFVRYWWSMALAILAWLVVLGVSAAGCGDDTYRCTRLQDNVCVEWERG